MSKPSLIQRRSQPVVFYLPPPLQAVLARAVSDELCTISSYARKAVVDRLRADGHLAQPEKHQYAA
jgi:hypothetical protein